MSQDSLGPQQLSTLQSAPVPGFGTCERPGMAERTRAPGPGAYKARPALGAPLRTPQATHHSKVDMGVCTQNRIVGARRAAGGLHKAERVGGGLWQRNTRLGRPHVHIYGP